ncbi:MAG: hypothetical protein ACI9UJ_002610 [bacterium]|jgi:hypothetical protein
MNIKKSICIFAVSIAVISVSVHAVPLKQEKIDGQKVEEKKLKERTELELRLLLLGEDTTQQESYCPFWPDC